MSLSPFVELLLRAKLALVVLIGQITIYVLIFDAVKLHKERVIELVVTSILLWTAYGLSLLSDKLKEHRALAAFEKECDERFAALDKEYKDKISVLELEIERLEK